jgi:hypothetical protein
MITSHDLLLQLLFDARVPEVLNLIVGSARQM